MEKSILSSIKSPENLKNLTIKELKQLCAEIRRDIIQVVTTNGGHLSSNLGVVELTVALHRVFKSPKDKIVWDVGHQTYAHKLLTGRKEGFQSLRLKGGLSGFPKRAESEHDIIETGHASTSISAALGLLVGQELSGKEGKVIAVIGDGALTGGLAFEGLNNAGHLRKNLIIVLNDNKMAISKNVGALSRYSAHSILSRYLSRITATDYYQNLRDRIDRGIKVVPAFGYQIFEWVVKLKKGIKAVFFNETLFSELGFEYVGPIDGHNLSHLLQVFRAVSKLNRPVVVHVITTKGAGFPQAEGNPTLYHGVSPLALVDGKLEKKNTLTFSEAFSASLIQEAEKDSRIVAITAAMADGTGLAPFEKRFPNRFFDVGIAEQHALTFAAGLASAGLKPVVSIYSTFIQRAVDQVIHDIALPGLPVVLCLDRAGLVGSDGETHQGLYDIPIFRSIPGLTILAPSGAGELSSLLSYALTLNRPVIIRYPRSICCPACETPDVPVVTGQGFLEGETGEDTLLIGAGGIYREVFKAREILGKKGVKTDLYNLRFIKPLNEDYLKQLLSCYRAVFCFEESAALGGIGEQIGAFVLKEKIKTEYHYCGLADKVYPNATREELLSENRLDAQGIAELVISKEMGRLRLVPLVSRSHD